MNENKPRDLAQTRQICRANKQGTRYDYLASLILGKLDGVGSEGIDDTAEDWDYLTIKEFVERRFEPILVPRNTAPQTNAHHNAQEFFSLAAKRFALGVNGIVWYAHDGLPLYVRTRHGALTRATTDDEPYQSIRALARYCGWQEEYYHPPSWTEQLYIARRDYEVFTCFFDDGPDKYALRVRLAAFQAYLDGRLEITPLDEAFTESADSDDPPAPYRRNTRPHRTRLLTILEKTIARYYGEHFDPDDPETWTPQEAIVGWLQDKFKLSRRQAEAIDIVARPDSPQRRRHTP